MLVRALQKVIQGQAAQCIRLVEADAQRLPFPDDCFQITCIAFGLRNLTDMDRGLGEMIRVTQPEGRVAILEFSQPKHWPFGRLYRFYFRRLLPLVGQLLARNEDSAYHYLPASVLQFPDGETLAGRLRQHGLTEVRWYPFTFGIATLYVGRKSWFPLLTCWCVLHAARSSSAPRSGPCARPDAGTPSSIESCAGLSFYEFSENVELAARALLLPRRFGLDAIILFYDITTLPVAMGLPFLLRPEQGPVPDRPIRTLSDVERLDSQPDPERFRHVRELLQRVGRELDGQLAGDRLRGLAVHRGHLLHRDRQGLAEDADLRRRAAESLAGTAGPADSRHGAFPGDPGPRRG